MKFFKIYVKEEKTIPTIIKTSRKELELEVIAELPKEEGYYIMKEYEKEHGKALRIGIEAEYASRVEIKGAWGESILLRKSDINPNFWYEPSSIWIEDGFETTKESIFGLNACGEWSVNSYGQNGELLSFEKVKIIPSLLTLKQYNLMQLEVKKLFEELTYQPNEPDTRTIIRELNLSLYPLLKLERFLEEWKEWIYQIEENPTEVLLLERSKKKRVQIKKWDSHTILESKLFPYREKLSERIYRKNHHVIEHKMIKYMLERLKERVNQELKTERSAFENLVTVKNNLQRLNLINEVSDVSVIEKIKKRKDQIENDIKLLEVRRFKWDNILAVVEGCLNFSLFDVQEEEPDWSHIFVSHPIYRSVFETYEEIISLAPILTTQERDFEKAMVSSPHLYEVWILFQLIHQLQKVQFTNRNIASSMIEHFNEHGTLSGWKKSLSSSNGVVGIYYEKECRLQNGRKARPDYMLLFRNSKNLWDAHIIDAKYKPYTSMENRILENDMQNSARRYLTIEDGNVEIKSATLVHIDRRIGNWNVDYNRKYSLSHFSAAPEEIENISTYIKRTLHFFNKQVRTCPTCGEWAEKDDEKFKSTYICHSCNEVWVENTCKREYHPFPQTLPKLLKYPSGNYNIQVGNLWNVYCPVCSREVNGGKIQQNLRGDKV